MLLWLLNKTRFAVMFVTMDGNISHHTIAIPLSTLPQSLSRVVCM